ncbi:MAG TPA: hypothetical protein VKA67_13330, partial [Verrucomicrobiae bacterium]|nr:hypothetical protein [Verrucomicrobiae bacterium]
MWARTGHFGSRSKVHCRVLLQEIWLGGVLFAALSVRGADAPPVEAKPKVAPPAAWVVALPFNRPGTNKKITPGED